MTQQTIERKFAIYNDDAKQYQIIIPPHTEPFTLSNVTTKEQAEQFNHAHRNKENDVQAAYWCFTIGDWSDFDYTVNQLNYEQEVAQ